MQEMLLQQAELVASYCSSPQRRDPTISGLTAPSVTTYPTNSRLPLQTSDISRVSSLSPLHLLIVKDPSTPSAAWLRAKHLCGSGWPTLPGSQVALAPPPRSALSVSQSCRSAIQPATAQTDPGGPVRDWGRAASQPEQIRYSNATRQVRKSEFCFFAPQLSVQHFFIVRLYQIYP